MEKLIALVTGYRTYLIYAGVALLALAGAYMLGHWKGVNDQLLTTAKAETVAIQKGVQGRAEIENKVIQLSDPDLDGQLDRWMRD